MIEFSFSNLLQVISFISPFMLGFFLVVSSLFNQDLKGLVYLAGALIATMINIPIMKLIGEERPDEAPPLFCNLISWTDAETKYSSPSPTTLFIAFTATYVILPMYSNDNINYVVVVFLLAVLGIDWVTKVKSACTSNSGAALGVLIGFLLALSWYTAFFQAGYKSLLFFGAFNSNRVQCMKPSEQNFVCTATDATGQLIGKNIV
tara:strand:- start:481 stop:1095 length:615 start_codon:yes stop_codon:yes gene_type:complete